MIHKKLRPFIVKVSVLGYFPLYTIYTRGRANVQSTQKWEVNNLFVQSIFQFCAVNFSILSNNICIILINS